MGRGDRPIKRWRADRKRKKKERGKRKSAAAGSARRGQG